MRNATLTAHAEERLKERCKLTPDGLKSLLDNGASITVATQHGGRHAKRLLYSTPDKAWLIVVQDGKDAEVLTVMPLEYVENRLPVTADQKRRARKQARIFGAAQRICAEGQFSALPVGAVTDLEATQVNPHLQSALLSSSSPGAGWWICLRYSQEGRLHLKKLPRTPSEDGHPSNWTDLNPIHAWFGERLLEAAIPAWAIQSICAHRKSEIHPADCLLEHLLMPTQNLEQCR